MKVLLDGSALLHRRLGIGSYAYNLFAALVEVEPSWDWHIVYAHWRRPFHPPESFGGRAAVHRRRVPGRLWRWLFLEGRLSVSALVPGVSVYHSPDPVGARLARGMTVLTIHDTLTTNPKLIEQFPPPHPNHPAVAYARRSIHRADHLIAISQSTKTDLLAHAGVDEGKVTVIPYGVAPSFRPMEPDVAEPVLVRYGITAREYLLFVGRLEPRKNLGVVLDALRILREDFSLEPPLLVVNGGGDGGHREAQAKIQAYGLERQVQFIQYVEHSDMPAIYARAAALVHAALYEGFGLPPLEAMACGRPVVAAAAASIPEVVGDAGLLVPPEDTEGIAAALSRALTDSAASRELMQRGQRRARRFTWQATATATIQVYRGQAVPDWDDRGTASATEQRPEATEHLAAS